jgi:DNA end-binding protein Ku
MATRALWSGAISFGLVNIPVKLYRATASSSAKGVSFHQIHSKCGTRLQHRRWCPKEDVEVPWDEVAKGYEVSKGRYVILREEDLDQLLPEDNYAAISIDAFVSLSEVDPIYFDRAYYVAPDGPPRAYGILHHVLEEAGRVAVARVRLRTRSHLAMVRVQGKHLLLSTLFFADEIVDPAKVTTLEEKEPKLDKRQVEVARQLVDSMTTEWRPEQYQDDYTKKVEQVIEARLSEGAVSESLAPEEKRAQVVDLLAALKKSVEERGRRPGAGAARPARARTSRPRRTRKQRARG